MFHKACGSLEKRLNGRAVDRVEETKTPLLVFGVMAGIGNNLF